MGGMESSFLLNCIWLTLKISVIATVVSFVMGLSLAWFMARKNFPGKGIVDSLCLLPLVLPPTVIGYCLVMIFGRNGFIGKWLASFDITLIFSWQGAVVAATVVIFPLTFRSSRVALESVDHTIENAARTLGASETRVFFQVTLPLAWRGIVAGLSLAFARGMGEFGATLMIAGNLPGKTQTLSLAIYDAFQAGNDDKAILLVLLTAGICTFLLVVAEYITNRRDYTATVLR